MPSVTDDSAKQRRQLDAQIERWTAEAKKLVESYGSLPAPEDNDGIVPTNSQIWGSGARGFR